jgi:hypothetical protein
MANIKIEEITITDLVREMINLPQGWHEEVYVENGEVVFSAPLTQNSWVGKSDAPSEQLDSCIGKINSLDDLPEDMHKRKDGQYELDMGDSHDNSLYNDYDKIVEGEFFQKAEILSEDDVINILADVYTEDSELSKLLEKIQDV